MSYFPSDVPFMSEEELKENGIEIPKDSQTTQDLISRQAAIDALKDEMRTVGGYYCEEDRIIYENDAIEAIQILPAVQSEPWKGR